MTTQQLVKIILHPSNSELKQLAELLLYKTANERKELTSSILEHMGTMCQKG